MDFPAVIGRCSSIHRRDNDVALDSDAVLGVDGPNGQHNLHQVGPGALAVEGGDIVDQ